MDYGHQMLSLGHRHLFLMSPRLLVMPTTVWWRLTRDRFLLYNIFQGSISFCSRSLCTSSRVPSIRIEQRGFLHDVQFLIMDESLSCFLCIPLHRQHSRVSRYPEDFILFPALCSAKYRTLAIEQAARRTQGMSHLYLTGACRWRRYLRRKWKQPESLNLGVRDEVARRTSEAKGMMDIVSVMSYVRTAVSIGWCVTTQYSVLETLVLCKRVSSLDEIYSTVDILMKRETEIK